MKGKEFKRLFQKNKKIMITALFALFVVGETFAWVNQSTEITNELKAHTTNVSIQEITDDDLTVGGTEKKEVSFKNEGSSDVFVRMSFEEYWTYTAADGANLQLPNTTDSGEDIAGKIWNTVEGQEFSKLWELHDDGWYYYKKVLPVGTSTADVLKIVEFKEFSEDLEQYADAEYHLYFKVETVQASTSSLSKTPNRVDVNTKATTTVFGRAGEIDFTSSGPAYAVTWAK